MSSLCQTRVLELSESDATVTCARYAQHGVKMLSARRQAWQVADPRERTEAAHWATGRPCVTHILLIFTDDLALVKDVFVSKGGIAHPHLLASQHCGRHPGRGDSERKPFVQKGKLNPARTQKGCGSRCSIADQSVSQSVISRSRPALTPPPARSPAPPLPVEHKYRVSPTILTLKFN